MKNNLRTHIGKYQANNLDWMKYAKNPGVQTSLTFLLSVGIVTIFILFAVRPTLLQIAELKTNINASRKLVDQLTTKANTLSMIAAKWDTITKGLPYLNATLPFGSEYRMLNKELVVMANSAGVTLENLSLDKSLIYIQGIDPYKIDEGMEIVPMKVTLKVTGSYTQLESFLTTLQATDRLLRVDNLSLEPVVSKSANPTQGLTMNISCTAYYMSKLNVAGATVQQATSTKEPEL